MSTRVLKSDFHLARHSVLDELTFNRDFDASQSATINKGVQPWTYHPSYSGFQTPQTATRREKRLPVTMMDMSLSSTASLPQVSPSASLRNSLRIKHNPELRGFVTDKLTNAPHERAQLARAPFRCARRQPTRPAARRQHALRPRECGLGAARPPPSPTVLARDGARLRLPHGRTVEHTLVSSHQHDLLINISTPTEYPAVHAPGMMGAAPRAPVLVPERPMPMHEPGRHRYFLGDVPPKIR